MCGAPGRVNRDRQQRARSKPDLFLEGLLLALDDAKLRFELLHLEPRFWQDDPALALRSVCVCVCVCVRVCVGVCLGSTPDNSRVPGVPSVNVATPARGALGTARAVSGGARARPARSSRAARSFAPRPAPARRRVATAGCHVPTLRGARHAPRCAPYAARRVARRMPRLQHAMPRVASAYGP